MNHIIKQEITIVRNSDGEIFTVGDNTKYGCINTFYIKNNYLLATTVLESHGKYLKDLEKIKQPLLKTEDGVDIFENDITYNVDTLSQIYKLDVNPKIWTSKCSKSSRFRYFSTKEKAEEYVLMNKPCLSLQEVWDVFDIKLPSIGSRRLKLKNLVKTKIK
jgi:hypothetical protein